jgi:protein-S-isoprenylcysteine O-methyltransferase Ste14
MKNKINAALTVIITAGAAAIAGLVVSMFSYFSLLAFITVVLFTLGELAIIYFMRRYVLKRKQNIFSIISIALIGVTYIAAFIDINFGEYILPAWCSWLGIILFFSGDYLLITSLTAIPRHAKEEYAEEIEIGEQAISVHGPYDVVRHPINLAGILLAFAVPLILGSAFAFIASGVASIFIIIHAVTVENYRFENYTWYYDYTKKVPYMVIPVIW